MRASDDDRQRVIDTLQQHTAAGRLSLDEFSDRVGAVFSATTLDELRATTIDLPVAASTVEPVDPHADGARQLAIAFAVAVAVIILLGVVYRLIAR